MDYGHLVAQMSPQCQTETMNLGSNDSSILKSLDSNGASPFMCNDAYAGTGSIAMSDLDSSLFATPSDERITIFGGKTSDIKEILVCESGIFGYESKSHQVCAQTMQKEGFSYLKYVDSEDQGVFSGCIICIGIRRKMSYARWLKCHKTQILIPFSSIAKFWYCYRPEDQTHYIMTPLITTLALHRTSVLAPRVGDVHLAFGVERFIYRSSTDLRELEKNFFHGTATPGELPFPAYLNAKGSCDLLWSNSYDQIVMGCAYDGNRVCACPVYENLSDLAERMFRVEVIDDRENFGEWIISVFLRLILAVFKWLLNLIPSSIYVTAVLCLFSYWTYIQIFRNHYLALGATVLSYIAFGQFGIKY